MICRNLSQIVERDKTRQDKDLFQYFGINIEVVQKYSQMTTLGTQNLRPLLTGGRCSNVDLYIKMEILVVVDTWSLFEGSRSLGYILP